MLDIDKDVCQTVLKIKKMVRWLICYAQEGSNSTGKDYFIIINMMIDVRPRKTTTEKIFHVKNIVHAHRSRSSGVY